MGLKGKMIGQTHVQHSGVGDAFHDLFAQNPHLVPTACTEVQGFTLLDGAIGVVGSKVHWRYTYDGKDYEATEIIEAMDEENQTITFKVIDGDLMKLYKSFIITYHVDTKGEDNLITWTMDYEKLEEDTPHPGALLSYFLRLIEDIEAHHLEDDA